jgi:trans-aconitate 2-methyltransferase
MSTTNASHEWNSQAYHKVSNPQFGWGLKVLERVQLRGDERVMDAGCGSGRLTEKLVERLPRGEVVGVDLSQNMLQQAAEHLQGSNGRVSLLQADLANLPFNAEFDGIFSTAAFHWVKDHDTLFRSLARSLKPGGWMVAQCGGGANLQRARERIHVLMRTPKYAPFFRDWQSPWEYADDRTTADRMTRAGFTDVRTWLEPAPITFPNAESYREFIGPVILRPFLNAITDEQVRDNFLNDVVQQGAEDGFELDYWRLNLEGRKA